MITPPSTNLTQLTYRMYEAVRREPLITLIYSVPSCLDERKQLRWLCGVRYTVFSDVR